MLLMRYAAILNPVDVQGAAIYATELALWIGIMLCGVAFNLREWLGWRQPSQDEAASEEVDSPASGDSPASSVFQTSAASRLRRRVVQTLPLRRV